MSAERIEKRFFIILGCLVYGLAYLYGYFIEFPLHRAAKWNANTITEMLIANGADVNRNTTHWREGWVGMGMFGNFFLDYDRGEPTSPLHVAARWNAKETAEVLLANGAHVYLANSDGWSALHVAARWNAKETAEVLLASGANVHVKTDSDNWTAWDVAVKYGSKEVAELLLKHRAK